MKSFLIILLTIIQLNIIHAEKNEIDFTEISYEEYWENLDYVKEAKLKDPYKKFNMSMLTVLFIIDIAFLRGMANIYKTTIPKCLRNRVGSFIQNTTELKVAMNDIMQANPKEAAKSTTRFLINTVFGCCGLFDVAKKAKVKYHNNDFGITLGIWGVPCGPYLITPNGPSSFRDFFALTIESFLNPFKYTSLCNLFRKGGFGYSALKIIHNRHISLSQTKKLGKSKNPYALIKLAYIQPREAKIAKKRFDVLKKKALMKSALSEKQSIGK